MMKLRLMCVMPFMLFTDTVLAFPTGAGTCDVVANFSTITNMFSRTRNESPGGYELSSNVMTYNPFEHVELTLTATGVGDQAVFTGIVVSVVDEMGNKVGTFDFNSETEVRECDGSAMMAATHTIAHGSVNSRTLFWIPPSETVGNVYVLAYVLSGERANQSSQEFYRLVRGDGAITIEEDLDVIFLSDFE